MRTTVHYTIFDKDKNIIRDRFALCFSNEVDKCYLNEVYFTYYIKSCKLTKEQIKDYIAFLQKIPYFKTIDFTDVLKTLTFTFDVTKTNGTHMFLVLTVLRYLEEDTDIVRFILKNKDSRLHKNKILLLSTRYSSNAGHAISLYPTDMSIKNHKIVSIGNPDNFILKSGLHSVYYPHGSWQRDETILKNYNLKLL